jgi:hypothetical protein
MSPASDQLVGRVIGSKDLCDLLSALYCQQKLGKTSHTLNEPTLLHKSPSPKVSDDDAAMQEDDDLMTGVLAAGQNTPYVLVEAGCTRKELAMIG